jgi:hypothetical protein
MPDKNPTPPLPADLAARQLHEFGRLLDAIECGRIPVNARQYRKAAVRALKALRANYDAAAVLDACAVSPALAELRDNVRFEREAAAQPQRPAIPGLTGTRA